MNAPRRHAVPTGVTQQMQIESRRLEAVDDVPSFLRAGLRGRGEYRCADCGYGITVRRTLPECPMCRGTAWEEPGAGASAGPVL